MNIKEYEWGIRLNNPYNKAIQTKLVNGEVHIGFFDDDGIFKFIPYNEAKNKILNIQDIVIFRDNRSLILFRTADSHIFTPIYTKYSDRLNSKIYDQVKPGDNVEILHELAATTQQHIKWRRNKYTDFERKFVKIKAPTFIGENGYFEYMKVSVLCSSDTTKEDIVKYRKAIDEAVLDKIELSKRFQNYQIPLNVLQVSNIVLTKDKRLEYTFEIKGEIRKILEETTELIKENTIYE